MTLTHVQQWKGNSSEVCRKENNDLINSELTGVSVQYIGLTLDDMVNTGLEDEFVQPCGEILDYMVRLVLVGALI